MARILITTFGSYGDLYPYLAVGRELRLRGHHVTLATSAAYRAKAEAVGLTFAPVRPDVDLGDRKFMEWVFDTRRGSERIVRGMSEQIRDSYDDTLPLVEGVDLLITQPLTFAGPLIAAKRGLRWVSTVLAPMSVTSVYDPPVLPQAPWLRNWKFLGPGFWQWLLVRVGHKMALDWVKPVVDFGREIGLRDEQIGHPLFGGARSPWLTLAMFSSLLAKPRPDWPVPVAVTGFPFFESGGELAPELEAFLQAGPPPVIFTLGSSAVGAAGHFYRDSFQAVQRLGMRAIFLTGSHPQGLPEKLPPEMLEWGYAPHSTLFPRAAVNVIHGGVGSAAEALRSGRPMMIVPFAHDQFDNAERCLRLGVARWTSRAAYSASKAERALKELLTDAEMDERCAGIARQIRGENGTAAAADAVEGLLKGHSKFTTH